VSFTILVTAVLAVQTPAGDSSAYLDAEARRLVAASRSRRETIDRSISAYRTTMQERIGVGIRALRRDRMLYRRELALRINWRRDSVAQVDVIGARQSVPAAAPKRSLPEDLKRDAGDYAFDPADDRLTIGFNSSRRDTTSDSTRRRNGLEFQHPLAPGSEAHYRFATGDSSFVVFPDGRTIRLRELRIIPRRLDVRLLTGSFWIDEASHAVVRALVRPARGFDFEQDVGDDDDDIPGFVKPIRVEFRFLTIDYGLWEGRWWMPRLIAMDAVATAGSFLQMPMRYELVYSDYDVTGDTTQRRVARPPPATLAEDSIARAACHEREEKEQISCRCRDGKGQCQAFRVNLPTDTVALLSSAMLPPSFGSADDTLLSAGEMEELTRAVGKLPGAPWQFSARPPRWGLARYNRIEGLSLGARGELELGRLRADGTARIATSDATPDFEAGLVRETINTRLRLAGYYRLAAVDPAARSLGIGNSLNALLLGRDDGDYFRGTGAELTIAPPVTLPQRFAVRVYAEQQRARQKVTDFSIPNLFNNDHLFRDNIIADSADQLGAALTFRTQRGIDPERNRWNAEVNLDAGTGTYDFVRGSSTLRMTVPMGRLATAVELAGGMSAGRVPVQSRWYLGGPGTMRGYDGNAQSGDGFWRARVEVANQWPAARLVLFGDVGTAGPRDHLSVAKHIAGVGAGASFLDGLVRIDVTRAIRTPTGWRVDFYSDAAL
jgi:hypothetical protein